jgi:drug/metabolite transporter (DMT)-like permease
MPERDVFVFKTALGFVGVVALAVGANVMLKLGAAAPAGQRVVFGLFDWKSALGFALFGCGGLIYAVLLRWVPLNVAQSFTAAQFIGVVLAASLLLSETISPVRWLGIACICLGILLVGISAQAPGGGLQ